MPNNQAIAPASGQTITLDSVSSTTNNPYGFSSVTATTHTVTASVPAGHRVSYTMCNNSTSCHNNAPSVATSVTASVPNGGYVDLWWHYEKPATCTVSLSASTIDTSQTVTATINGTPDAYDYLYSPVRFWLERRDGAAIPGFTGISPLPTQYGQPPASPTKYYYLLAQYLPSSRYGSISTSLSLSGIPVGSYFLHCDSPNNPYSNTNTNKCSGNPFCSYESYPESTMACTTDQWQSCSSSDNSVLTVNNPPTPTPAPFPIRSIRSIR
jgi:hypothetical protein